ncbi:MAG: hypothetical protein HY536_01915 [Candidatus Colwellbacteria bacterium]|nr:hypothetical protein [Candidatus Colwellbacteria bacterium]
MRIFRKRLVVWSVVVLAAAGLFAGGYLAWTKWSGGREKSGRYSAVYLTTGEIYIGRLSLFPRVSMENPYLLQIVADEKDKAKTVPQLMPLSDVVWSPKRLYINRDRIVFYAPVKSESEAAKALAGKEAGR